MSMTLAVPGPDGMMPAPSMDTEIEGIGDLSELTDEELEQALSDAGLLLRRQAADFSLGGILAFTHIVGRDEGGRPLESAEIHVSWYEHIFWCWAHGLVPVILAPWGHGKSVNIAIYLPTWLIGIDPNLRGKIVSNSDDNARKRVKSVRRLIGDTPKEMSRDLRSVFPHLRRDRRGDWNDHAITVIRPKGSVAADASLEAHGVFGTGIGGRCDFLIGDDTTDRRNSIEQPTSRSRVVSTYAGTWQSRLEPHGRQAAIMTRWHESDLSGHWMTQAKYCVMVQSVSPRRTHIDVAVHNAPAGHPVPDRLPLWEARWGRSQLDERRREIGDREYARGFEQKAISDEELWFPHLGTALRPCRTEDIAGISESRRAVGWDPAGHSRRGVALVVIAVTRSGMRIPVDVRCAQLTEPAAAAQMDEIDIMHRPDVVGVESNATQDSIEAWARDTERSWWHKVRPFVTGRNKADPEFGLRSLDIEFERGAWIVPMKETVHPSTGRRCPEAAGGVPLDEHAKLCECSWCLWLSQFRTYPGCDATDLVMATWFAREMARDHLGGGDLPAGIRPERARRERPESLRVAMESVRARGLRDRSGESFLREGGRAAARGGNVW